MSTANETATPVIITAPTARNGVTLLQRLLNSSRRIIVYGENGHFCESLPRLIMSVQQDHQRARAELDATRRRFLEQTTEFWSSALWPDSGGYLRASVEGFRHLVKYYQQCSHRYGFERWGIKHPFSSVYLMDWFTGLLPEARYVYIYRNLFDVARSSKARRFVESLEDFTQLATTWCDSVKTVLHAQPAGMLVIRHEDLVRDQAHWLAQLAEFTGVSGIDATVMTRKFNTFRGSASQGRATDQYIPPAELTADETDALRRAAGPLLDELGYEDRAPAELAGRPS